MSPSYGPCFLRLTSVSLLALSLVACEDDVTFVPLQDAASTSGDGGADAVSPADGGLADAEPPTFSPRGLVAVHSDYQTSSVSLLDRNGGLAKGDCLHSGSVSAKLNLALTGDVTLPSQPAANGEVLLIDRSAATLTYVDPATCTPSRQVNVGTGFAANPHDVVAVTPNRAFVTRYEPSPTPPTAEAPFLGGNDLLVFDPQTGAPTARIDLLPYASLAGVLPRPDRVVQAGGKLYVSLNNLSSDFSAAGPGRIAIVDPSTNQVTGTLELPTLKNCGEMAVAGPQVLVVVCGGAFSDGAQQANHAGIARIDLGTGIAQIVASNLFGNRSVSQGSLAALDEQRVLAVTSGDFGGPATDQLWLASFAAQAPAPQSVAAATDSFVFGGLLHDAGQGRLYVADGSASAPRVRVFALSGGSTLTPLAPLETSPTNRLPPRHLAWF